MNVVSIIQKTKEQIKEWRLQGLSIGFVPTMGYLHEGHLSLIKKAREENDKVVVSIFVNPMQFGPTEDLATYPRDMESDCKLCDSVHTDLIFHPHPEEMYAKDFCCYIDMNHVSTELCGQSRPVHFRGVCTVVNKLFHIVTPDKAYFGQKDAQQVAVIKRMVRDLNMDVEIIVCPIVREEDGLAKSSRNTYLSPKERSAALIVSQSIFLGQQLVENGERKAARVISAITRNINTEPLAKIDYVEVVDSINISKVKTLEGSILVAVAVYFGKTRLIDNFIVELT